MVIEFAKLNPALFGNCLQDLWYQKEDLKLREGVTYHYGLPYKVHFSSVTGTRRKVERHISCPLERAYDSHILFLTTQWKKSLGESETADYPRKILIRKKVINFPSQLERQKKNVFGNWCYLLIQYQWGIKLESSEALHHFYEWQLCFFSKRWKQFSWSDIQRFFLFRPVLFHCFIGPAWPVGNYFWHSESPKARKSESISWHNLIISFSPLIASTGSQQCLSLRTSQLCAQYKLPAGAQSPWSFWQIPLRSNGLDVAGGGHGDLNLLAVKIGRWDG